MYTKRQAELAWKRLRRHVTAVEKIRRRFWCPFSGRPVLFVCCISLIDKEGGQSVLESGVLRLAKLDLVDKWLFLLRLRRELSGSNSVGRMPASRCLLYF